MSEMNYPSRKQKFTDFLKSGKGITSTLVLIFALMVIFAGLALAYEKIVKIEYSNPTIEEQAKMKECELAKPELAKCYDGKYFGKIGSPKNRKFTFVIIGSLLLLVAFMVIFSYFKMVSVTITSKK